MPLLGCIADDFTGATDLASTLVRQGMRAIQLIGVPEGPLPEADALIIALKSRTIPAADAIAQSLAACEALLAAGATQIMFKYCSTFDSTEAGNIGPVAEALLRRLDAPFAIACPAFPTNGRTVYQGHLFVAAKLLSESGMENHPLTPMRDADLVRVLGRQSEGSVGLISFGVVERGAAAIRDEVTRLRDANRRFAIADAVTDAHLMALGDGGSRVGFDAGRVVHFLHAILDGQGLGAVGRRRAGGYGRTRGHGQYDGRDGWARGGHVRRGRRLRSISCG